jgi:L-iditol 2-dehydrogenase
LGGLHLREMDKPPLPGDDWVRVRTLLGGICGTDLAIIAQKYPPNSILQAFSSGPMVMGHENLAVVDEVGPGVDSSWLGKRVCVEPTLNCIPRGIDPPCRPCQMGQFGACENFGAGAGQAGCGKYNLPPGTSIGYNSKTGGSFGQYFVAHVSQLIAPPTTISDELASLTDPISCSLHAVLRADLSNAGRVLVYGSGVIGLSLIACLRAVGYAGIIDVPARHEYLDSMAIKFGASCVLKLGPSRRERFRAVADRTGAVVSESRFRNFMLCGGYDVSFDCVGSAVATEECLKWTAARGQMVIVGSGGGAGVDLTPIWFRELQILGAYGRGSENFQSQTIGTYQLTHKLMAEGKLDLSPMLTHKFRIDQYRQAFAISLNKSAARAIKVAFDFR